MPSFVMAAFVDYAERVMLEQLMPRELFQMVETAKKTNAFGVGLFDKDKDGGGLKEGKSWEEAYDRQIESLKQKYTKEEMEAIVGTIEREREEVIEIMDREGGDMDEVMSRVRMKTLQIRELII